MIAMPMKAVLGIALAAVLAGCASDGGMSTGSVQPLSNAEARVDPACVTLASQIDTIRKDGTIERLEKAAAGSGGNVQVKRTAIQKQAELNKLNADYQTKCGTTTPSKSTTAAAMPAVGAPTAATPMVAPAAKAAKTAAAASGVTQVAPGIGVAKKAATATALPAPTADAKAE
jgi:hypothetical protein